MRASIWRTASPLRQSPIETYLRGLAEGSLPESLRGVVQAGIDAVIGNANLAGSLRDMLDSGQTFVWKLVQEPAVIEWFCAVTCIARQVAMRCSSIVVS